MKIDNILKHSHGSVLFSVLLTATLLLASCDVHQWPEPPHDPVTPDIPSIPEGEQKVTLALNLYYNTGFSYSLHTYDSKTDVLSPSSANTPSGYDNLDNLTPGTNMKVTVKVHRNNGSRTLVASESFVTQQDNGFDTSVELEVPSNNEYIVTVWSHILDNGGSAFYNDNDFNSIGLIEENFAGNTDLRDAFRGQLSLSVPEDGIVSGVVEMQRPLGKLEFIATGVNDFVAREQQGQPKSGRATPAEEYTVVISYPAYYPSSYTAIDDRLESSSTGYGYSSAITLGESSTDEMSLGFDYVMLNNVSDASVQVKVSIFDGNGVSVASTSTLTVPMQRDIHTIVRSNFFDNNASGNGGVGIDPDFDGDYNVPLP